MSVANRSAWFSKLPLQSFLLVLNISHKNNFTNQYLALETTQGPYSEIEQMLVIRVKIVIYMDKLSTAFVCGLSKYLGCNHFVPPKKLSKGDAITSFLLSQLLVATDLTSGFLAD